MVAKVKDWAIVVHGGAKEIAPGEEAANRQGCRRALAAGTAVLAIGGTALDAAEAAVRVLEADPAFNAGLGSALNEAGEVEMCAALMDGSDYSLGAVATIKGVRHPVSVARVLVAEEEVLLAGDGARAFAEEQGAELCAPEELIVQKERVAEHDTVGAVALDQSGNLAAATSTGGLPGARVGRLGDSALPGCGYFADNAVGAIALSGDGEAIARLAIASQIMHLMPDMGPEQAIRKALSRLPHLGGDGGGIALTKTGAIGWWHNSPQFAVACASSADPEGGVWLSKEEE